LAAKVRWETAERCVSRHSEPSSPMICHGSWNRRGLQRLLHTLIRKGLPERLQLPSPLQRPGNSVKPVHRPAPPGYLMQFWNTRPRAKCGAGLLIASQTPATVPVEAVAKTLGNGSLVTAPDTVPFAVWCAANHLDNYVEAITLTISGDGDCDTNAAIVGGIVALSVGREGIPAEWRKEKELLPFVSGA